MNMWQWHRCTTPTLVSQSLTLTQCRSVGTSHEWCMSNQKSTVINSLVIKRGCQNVFPRFQPGAVWIGVFCVAFSIFTFFFSRFCWLFNMNSISVYCLQIHKFHFLITFSLKRSSKVLFTRLKIILLQYFQFFILNFNKISSIQTDPNCQSFKLVINSWSWKRL